MLEPRGFDADGNPILIETSLKNEKDEKFLINLRKIIDEAYPEYGDLSPGLDPLVLGVLDTAIMAISAMIHLARGGYLERNVQSDKNLDKEIEEYGTCSCCVRDSEIDERGLLAL